MEKLAVKLAAMGVVVVVLVVVLYRIGWLVTERQARRDGVIHDIAKSSSGEQQLTGPMLVVPYQKTVWEWHENPRGERHLESREVSGQLHLLPEIFTLEGEARTELRARGIYEARLYHAHLRIRTDFDVPSHFGLGPDATGYRFGQPFIALGVSDIRGIESPLAAHLNDQPVKILPGSGTALLPGGLHVMTPFTSSEQPTQVQLTMELPLLGTSELHIIPVGRQTQVQLTSNWPHPSFTGDFLPLQRQIDAGGFHARWATSFFATSLEDAMHSCEEHGSCEEIFAQRLGVSFVDPVDQYLKTDRAIKYALLFITVTFAGFFLFDVLRNSPIHPIQYGLVGAALALFYLLLLSLSEHLGFAVAYLLSSTACVGLIAFYVSHILHSWARGLSFGCGLAILYGCLFGLLNADDYALLMGSLLIFALLAAVMVSTRNINWSTMREVVE